MTDLNNQVTIVFEDGTRKTVSAKKARRHKRKGPDVEIYKWKKRQEQKAYAKKLGGRALSKFLKKYEEEEIVKIAEGEK